MRGSVRSYKHLHLATVVIAFITSVDAAQPRIDISDNKYCLSDIRIRGQVAADIEKQLPLIPERNFSEKYIDGVGRRLVRAIPLHYRHRGFVYRFDVVNVRDVNAFAVTGGPLHMDGGLIESAASEGQLAGVMAHELSPEFLNSRPNTRHRCERINREANRSLGRGASDMTRHNFNCEIPFLPWFPGPQCSLAIITRR